MRPPQADPPRPPWDARPFRGLDPISGIWRRGLRQGAGPTPPPRSAAQAPPPPACEVLPILILAGIAAVHGPPPPPIFPACCGPVQSPVRGVCRFGERRSLDVLNTKIPGIRATVPLCPPCIAGQFAFKMQPLPQENPDCTKSHVDPRHTFFLAVRQKIFVS